MYDALSVALSMTKCVTPMGPATDTKSRSVFLRDSCVGCDAVAETL